MNRLLKNPLFSASAPCAAFKERPIGFVDVGARGGIHPLVEPLAGVTAVLGFEPDVVECKRLHDDLALECPWAVYEIEPIALAETDGESILYLLSVPTNHSLRPPNLGLTQRYTMTKFQKVDQVSLKTASLDTLLFGRRQSEEYWGEFLKLDTQGTELEILKGARRTLSERSVAVFSEVEFCQIYEGQKLFSDIELYLREFGFSFYGFTKIGQRSCKRLDKRSEIGRERVLYADAVFLKDPLPGGFQQIPLSRRGNYVLFACSLLLGYHDFALELALSTWAKGDEAKRIEDLVHAQAAYAPSQAYDEALELVERVRRNPELANVEVGRFVDKRRYQYDYDDVVITSS